jgi:hypothetical protein
VKGLGRHANERDHHAHRGLCRGSAFIGRGELRRRGRDGRRLTPKEAAVGGEEYDDDRVPREVHVPLRFTRPSGGAGDDRADHAAPDHHDHDDHDGVEHELQGHL